MFHEISAGLVLTGALLSATERLHLYSTTDADARWKRIGQHEHALFEKLRAQIPGKTPLASDPSDPTPPSRPLGNRYPQEPVHESFQQHRGEAPEVKPVRPPPA